MAHVHLGLIKLSYLAISYSSSLLCRVNGPNEHFIRSIRQIQAMDTPYDAALFMEPDVHPWKEKWLDQIMEEVTQKRPFSIFGSENHGMIWRQYRDSMPIPLRHHLTGNSVFNLTDSFFNRFVEELEAERETIYRAIVSFRWVSEQPCYEITTKYSICLYGFYPRLFPSAL